MSKSYSEQLKDPRWQKKRLEIMQRDGFKCRLCGDSETTLNIHHIKYNKNCSPWEYDNELLITLCQHCHNEVEENKVFIKDFSKVKILKSDKWSRGSRIMFLSVPGVVSMNIYDSNDMKVSGFDFEDEISAIIDVFKNGL